MLRRRQCKRIFENMIRFGKTFLNVAPVELKVRTDIGPFYRLELGKIGKTGFRNTNGFVNQSRSWLQCLVNIQNGRQLFVFHLDQTQRLFSRVHVQGRNRRHRIAHVPHFIHGDDGLIFKYRAVVRLDAFVVKNVIARNHRQHPRNFECLGSVDTLDARVRQRAAQNFSMAHPRHAHVRQILRAAGHLGFVIQTAKCFTNIC